MPADDQTPSHRPHGPVSAGILLYREGPDGLRILLAHPGGPYFARKDAGAWSMPKGLIERDEAPAAAALREFQEELGWTPTGDLAPLGEARMRSGKRVIAFAVQTQEDEAEIVARFSPGAFTMPWPPGSGKTAQFPEVDRIAFFSIHEAIEKLNLDQTAFLERLCTLQRSGSC